MMLLCGGIMALHFNLIGTFLLCLGLMLWQALFGHTLFFCTLFLLLILLYQWKKQKLSYFDVFWVASFLMNLWYVLGSWGNVRQHDYFNFYMHADYFIVHNFFLSRPIDYLQSVYFQPPLWGLICGGVTKLMMSFGFAKEAGFDFVRFVSLFSISGCGIIFARMLALFNRDKIICMFVFAVYVFLPINGIMANLVNNDTIVYFLMSATLYQTLKWYESNGWREVLIIGILLFVGAMMKFSALMILPAIGVLGLFKLYYAQNKFALKLWGQFAFIGLMAMFGFAWGWMLLYHHLPLTPPPINNDFQNMTHFSLWERMFSLKMLMMPYADIRAGVLEPNVWISLIKTSLFGEWSWGSLFAAYVLYVWAIILGVLFVVVTFYAIFHKLSRDYAFNACFMVLILSVLISWASFWIVYPYFCSTEFRYVIILVPVMMLLLTRYLQQKSPSKTLSYILAGFVVWLICARFMLYLNTI